MLEYLLFCNQYTVWFGRSIVQIIWTLSSKIRLKYIFLLKFCGGLNFMIPCDIFISNSSCTTTTFWSPCSHLGLVKFQTMHIHKFNFDARFSTCQLDAMLVGRISSIWCSLWNHYIYWRSDVWLFSLTFSWNL